MTRFEEIGVQRQQDSYSEVDAIKQFQRSCRLCCLKGMQIECKRCAIAHEHEQVIEAFSILIESRRVVV